MIIEKKVTIKDIEICPLLDSIQLGWMAFWDCDCSDEQYEELGEAVLLVFESKLVEVYPPDLR